MPERTFDAATKCLGTARKVPMMDELHPVTLYHVTIDKRSVCREGLKTNEEIYKKRKKYIQGIGGSNDDFLSFTYDEKLVQDYAKDIITLAKVANGTLTFNNIEKYLDARDASSGMKWNPSFIFNNMYNKKFTFYRGEGHALYAYNESINDLKNERILDQKSIYEHVKGLDFNACKKLFEEMQVHLEPELTCRKNEKTFEFLKKMKFKSMRETDWRKSPFDERQKILFEILNRDYFSVRASAGGRRDPGFFGVYIETYKHIDPTNVGIFRVLSFLPQKLEKYLEHREFKEYGSVVDLYPSEGTRSPRYEIRVSSSEKEIRIHPRFTTMIEEIPIRRT